MKYTISEQKALKKLGIPDFRCMTKDKIVEFVSMIPRMDPEVAKAAISQFPEFKELAGEMSKSLSELVDKTFQSEKDSQNIFYDSCQSILESLKEQLQNESYSESERDKIRDEMLQILNLINEKDTEHKHFINAIFTKSLLGLSVIVAGAVTALGGNISLPKHESKDDD